MGPRVNAALRQRGPVTRSGPLRISRYAEAVSPERLLGELEALAFRLRVEVRVERLDRDLMASNAGGLCRVRGKALVLIEESLPIADRIAVLAGSLAQFDLEGVYVPPFVRARIEAARRG
jgi:hypothetical protein